MLVHVWTMRLTAVFLAGHCSLALATRSPVAERISRVEHGLLPAQVLKGTPLQPLTLAEEMQRLHVPGVSVAVIHDDKIAWAKGYGLTETGGVPVTPTTLFQAASISKSITAMGAMQMVQSGLLDLDQPVNHYLKSWKLSGLEGSNAVTLRQLLSHTAGTNVSGFPGYAAGTPVPTILQVLDGAAPASTEAVRVTSAPGAQWRYSGGGYSVIQQVMADVTSEPFERLMARRVLRPIGMTSSAFMQPASLALKRRAAMPHDTSGKAVPGGPASYPELAAAGMWTTPTDLAKFALSMQRSANGKNGRVLRRESAAAMLAPVKNDYGLGLEIAATGGALSFAHGGSNLGYQNSLFAYSTQGDGAVVMTNGDGGADIARALIRSIAAEYGWPTYRVVERSAISISAEAAKRMAGKYAIKGLGDFEITEKDGELTFWIKAGQGERLYASSPATFFVLSQPLELHFDAADADGGRLKAGSFDVRFDALR